MSIAVEHRRRWLRSFASLASGEAGSSALRLLATMWLASKLGPEHFGLVSLGLAAAGYIGVVSQAGLDVVSTREVAARRDLAIRYLGRVTGLRMVLATGVYAVFGLIVLVVPLDGMLRFVLLGMGLLVFTQAFDVRWSLVAEQRTGWAAGAAISGAIVLLVGVVALVDSPSSLAAVVAVTLLADAITQGMLVLASRRTYGSWRPTRPAGLTRPLLRAGIPLAVSRSARTLIITVDVFFVGLFRSTAETGRYALAGRIVAVGIAYLGLYQYTYLASLSKVIEDPRSVRELVRHAQRTVALLGLPVLGVLVAGTGLVVPVLFGSRFDGTVGLTQVMLLALLLLAFTGVWSAILFAHRRYRTIAGISTCAAVTNIAGNLVLLPTIGTVGASWATVAAEAVQLLLTRRAAQRVLDEVEATGLEADPADVRIGEA